MRTDPGMYLPNGRYLEPDDGWQPTPVTARRLAEHPELFTVWCGSQLRGFIERDDGHWIVHHVGDGQGPMAPRPGRVAQGFREALLKFGILG
jgi:hypothetical protein